MIINIIIIFNININIQCRPSHDFPETGPQAHPNRPVAVRSGWPLATHGSRPNNECNGGLDQLLDIIGYFTIFIVIIIIGYFYVLLLIIIDIFNCQ